MLTLKRVGPVSSLIANSLQKGQPMSLTIRSEHVTEAFLRAAGHHDSVIAEHHPAAPQLFSIAISREAGTRGPAVAAAVAERLGWKVYDHELLEQVARDLHVRVKLL